eukprot:355302-Chlamydomonas_euryale.AAC.8
MTRAFRASSSARAASTWRDVSADSAASARRSDATSVSSDSRSRRRTSRACGRMTHTRMGLSGPCIGWVLHALREQHASQGQAHNTHDVAWRWLPRGRPTTRMMLHGVGFPGAGPQHA